MREYCRDIDMMLRREPLRLRFSPPPSTTQYFDFRSQAISSMLSSPGPDAAAIRLPCLSDEAMLFILFSSSSYALLCLHHASAFTPRRRHLRQA